MHVMTAAAGLFKLARLAVGAMIGSLTTLSRRSLQMLRGRTNAQTDFVRIDCSPRLSIANLICGDTLEQQSCTWDAGEIISDCVKLS